MPDYYTWEHESKQRSQTTLRHAIEINAFSFEKRMSDALNETSTHHERKIALVGYATKENQTSSAIITITDGQPGSHVIEVLKHK